MGNVQEAASLSTLLAEGEGDAIAESRSVETVAARLAPWGSRQSGWVMTYGNREDSVE